MTFSSSFWHTRILQSRIHCMQTCQLVDCGHSLQEGELYSKRCHEQIQSSCVALFHQSKTGLVIYIHAIYLLFSHDFWVSVLNYQRSFLTATAADKLQRNLEHWKIWTKWLQCHTLFTLYNALSSENVGWSYLAANEQDMIIQLRKMCMLFSDFFNILHLKITKTYKEANKNTLTCPSCWTDCEPVCPCWWRTM